MGDKNVSKKRIIREIQKEKLTGDYAEPIKTKTLTQPSKKVGCPVTFAVKETSSVWEETNAIVGTIKFTQRQKYQVYSYCFQ